MPARKLLFTQEAVTALENLKCNKKHKALLKQVNKTLGLLETNIQHPGLHTHEYSSFTGANGEKIFEAYVQNQTSGAYRVFFHYGPDKGTGKKRIPVLTIVTITPHP